MGMPRLPWARVSVTAAPGRKWETRKSTAASRHTTCFAPLTPNALSPCKSVRLTCVALRNSRHRGLAIVAVAAAAAVAVGIRYQANALRNNELAQKNAHPDNLYVPVDRSGGGI